MSVYMLQAICVIRHFAYCLKFSGISRNACDHQAFRVMPEISSHFMKCLKIKAFFYTD